MPNSRMKWKAGKIYFLLICLIFCTACGREEAVFVAGEEPELPMITETVEESEFPKKPENGVQEGPVSGKLNINTAGVQELVTLPGIGESRASAIIEYRQKVGAFKEIEEIMDVNGIGTGIFQKISSLICVK